MVASKWTTQRRAKARDRRRGQADRTVGASNLLRSRLGRRVALIVCLAIVAIEAVILVPSYLRHRDDLLLQLESMGRTAAMAAFAHRGHASARDLRQAGRLLLRVEGITGGALYAPDTGLIASFGEVPHTGPDVLGPHGGSRLLADGQRFEIVLSPQSVGVPYSIVLRLDASWVGQELTAFVWRIAGLTLLISLFLSVVTLFILNRQVLQPMLRLRDSLVAARRDSRQAEQYVAAYRRADEIGEMVRALHALLREVSQAREQDLGASEQRFRDFADAASDFFWEMDQDLRFSYFSANMTLITGVHEDDMLGRTREETGIPDVEAGAWKQHLSDLQAKRPFRNFIHPRVRADGQRIYLSISGKPVYGSDGQFQGYRGVGSDITEAMRSEQALREAKERAEAANQAKSNFLALMSHELRTPLNAILGFSEMISTGVFGPAGDPRYTGYAVDIHRSGEHLLALINDILDLSKIEAGRFDLKLADVDVGEAIAASVAMVRPIADRAALTIEPQVAPDLPKLRADPRALQQILSNLLSNAMKFTPEGGRVGIYADVVDRHMRLQVTDTGIGIASEDIQRVLEPFNQVDSGYSRRFQGTGLGLAIIRALVELHGGRLRLHSVVGAGTRVVVTFPCPQQDASAHQHPVAAPAEDDIPTIPLASG